MANFKKEIEKFLCEEFCGSEIVSDGAGKESVNLVVKNFVIAHNIIVRLFDRPVVITLSGDLSSGVVGELMHLTEVALKAVISGDDERL